MLLRLPSDSAYVVAYAAAAKVGAITAGVNPRLAPPEQAAVSAAAGGALELDAPTQVEALRRPEPVAPLADDPERPVALVFTSGTTGEPKGALFRDRQLAAVTRIDVADAWGDPDRRADADARRHAVRPRRLHHEAAVVPAARDDHPHPRSVARRRRAGLHRRAPHPVARRRGPADGAAAARGPRGLRPRLRARPS